MEMKWRQILSKKIEGKKRKKIVVRRVSLGEGMH
jgi:hypothetical protein